VPIWIRVPPLVLALFGLPLSVFGLWIVSAGRSASAHGPTGGSSAIAGVGVLTTAIGVGYVLAAYGTWTLKPWGWTLAIGLLATGSLSSLLVLTSGAPGPGLLGLVVNGGLCWYLYESVRAFRNR